MRPVLAAALCLSSLGCSLLAPTRPAKLPPAPCTAFKVVDRFLLAGLKPCDPEMLRFKEHVRPGDMIVAYLDPPRCLFNGHPQFLIFPVGHALVAFQGDAGVNLVESMTGGVRVVNLDHMEKYTRVDVYRLANPALLDQARLREFAEVASVKLKRFDFFAMFGWNQPMRPNTPEEITGPHSCAAMAVAAYHYAGATLSCSEPGLTFLTPQQIARATAAPAVRPACSAPACVELPPPPLAKAPAKPPALKPVPVLAEFGRRSTLR